MDTARLESTKEALTETSARETARVGEGDALAEDIFGEEVVASMTQNGSTRDSAIEALEARVAARLEAERGGGAGGATKPGATPASTRDDGENPSAPAGRGRRIDPNGVRDEWAEIAEWHSREGERLEVEAMSRKRAGQKAMAAALAAQTEAKAAARRRSSRAPPRTRSWAS